MNLNRIKSVGFATALTLSSMFSPFSAAEPHQAAHIASPEQYQLLFENDEVLVLKMVLKPGESDLPHGHHNETVYFERGGTLTITEANGKSFEAPIPDGHVMWHQAWTHQVTNSGDTEVVAIIVEQKPKQH